MEAAGVNDRAQLAVAEAELRDRTNERWMRRGVTMLDPEHTYVDASVELGTDVTLFPGTILQGRTVIGEHAEIGPTRASSTAPSARAPSWRAASVARPRSAITPTSARSRRSNRAPASPPA